MVVYQLFVLPQMFRVLLSMLVGRGLSELTGGPDLFIATSQTERPAGFGSPAMLGTLDMEISEPRAAVAEPLWTRVEKTQAGGGALVMAVFMPR